VHVREVIEAEIANDAPALDALFERIGDRRRFADHTQQYETPSALETAEAVRRELSASDRARSRP
jgi:hypothetical protein